MAAQRHTVLAERKLDRFRSHGLHRCSGKLVNVDNSPQIS